MPTSTCLWCGVVLFCLVPPIILLLRWELFKIDPINQNWVRPTQPKNNPCKTLSLTRSDSSVLIFFSLFSSNCKRSYSSVLLGVYASLSVNIHSWLFFPLDGAKHGMTYSWNCTCTIRSLARHYLPITIVGHGCVFVNVLWDLTPICSCRVMDHFFKGGWHNMIWSIINGPHQQGLLGMWPISTWHAMTQTRH